MELLNVVKTYTPNTWTNSEQEEVHSWDTEFRQLQEQIESASNFKVSTITRVVRIQDLFHYGQFLIKEQLLLNSGLGDFYRVRRFIVVNQQYLHSIDKYNLDPRRCGLSLELKFSTTIYPSTSDVIVAVKVLTQDCNLSDIIPRNSSDYYVEYIITV